MVDRQMHSLGKRRVGASCGVLANTDTDSGTMMIKRARATYALLLSFSLLLLVVVVVVNDEQHVVGSCMRSAGALCAWCRWWVLEAVSGIAFALHSWMD
jgi:hypothetical protein